MNTKDDPDEQAASPACPLYQVYTCGPFLVKRWDGASSHAVPVGAWGGSHYPRLLLKVLLCSPGRQTSRGRLLETLWPDIDPEEAGRYLNDAAYRLRKVLQSPMGAESLLLTQDSHSYRLPSQQVLWVDAEEAVALLQRAEETERGGGDPLPLIEEATGYLSRGEFLAEEEHLSFYGRRATVARARRGGLLAQARIYQQRGWLRRGEALLSGIVEENALDEDALCALMRNLHQQGRTSEGLRLYEETKALLDREGLAPTEMTRATAQQVRGALAIGLEQELSVPSRAPVVQLPHTQFAAFPETAISGQGSYVLSTSRGLLPSSALVSMPFGETEGRDWATWFGLKLAQLLVDIDCRCGQLCLCLALQERLNQELNVMKPNPPNETYTLSRRQALVAIAALPSALLMPFQQEQWLPWQIEQFLSRCTGSLTACWHLLRGNEFTAVEEVIPQYLPVLLTILQQSSAYRQITAHLATQCHLLMSLVVRHRGIVHANQTDVWHCQQAVFYSETAGDDAIAIAALKQLADTFYYGQSYKGMREAYEKANHLIDTSQTPNEIPPLLRCRIYAGLADASIKDGQADAAHHYLKLLRDTFPAYLTDDRLPLYADCGVHSLCLWEGLTLLDFGERTNQQNHYRQASVVFAKVGQFPSTLIIPERTRLEIITHQAATAVRLKNMEQFRATIEKGAEGIRMLGSQKRRRELIDVYTQGVNMWPHESTVQNLAALLVS